MRVFSFDRLTSLWRLNYYRYNVDKTNLSAMKEIPFRPSASRQERPCKAELIYTEIKGKIDR